MTEAARARRLALFFSGTHVAVCLAGLVMPRAYGLGIAADPSTHGRLRLLAAADLAFAAAVALEPTPMRLRVGALSDVARAVALATLFHGAIRSRAILIAASLAGCATALHLSGRVRV